MHQGRVLGPLLFNIYLNDLLINCEHAVSFADDTVLLIDGKNWHETQNKANLILQNVFEWFGDNLLTINAKKSNFITFALSYDMLPENLNLQIRDNNEVLKLNRVESAKYLGIIIDQFMRWDKHTFQILKKADIYFSYFIN